LFISLVGICHTSTFQTEIVKKKSILFPYVVTVRLTFRHRSFAFKF
jgi:hypothetical protein